MRRIKEPEAYLTGDVVAGALRNLADEMERRPGRIKLVVTLSFATVEEIEAAQRKKKAQLVTTAPEART